MVVAEQWQNLKEERDEKIVDSMISFFDKKEHNRSEKKNAKKLIWIENGVKMSWRRQQCIEEGGSYLFWLKELLFF